MWRVLWLVALLLRTTSSALSRDAAASDTCTSRAVAAGGRELANASVLVPLGDLGVRGVETDAVDAADGAFSDGIFGEWRVTYPLRLYPELSLDASLLIFCSLHEAGDLDAVQRCAWTLARVSGKLRRARPAHWCRARLADGVIRDRATVRVREARPAGAPRPLAADGATIAVSARVVRDPAAAATVEADKATSWLCVDLSIIAESPEQAPINRTTQIALIAKHGATEWQFVILPRWPSELAAPVTAGGGCDSEALSPSVLRFSVSSLVHPSSAPVYLGEGLRGPRHGNLESHPPQ